MKHLYNELNLVEMIGEASVKHDHRVPEDVASRIAKRHDEIRAAADQLIRGARTHTSVAEVAELHEPKRTNNRDSLEFVRNIIPDKRVLK